MNLDSYYVLIETEDYCVIDGFGTFERAKKFIERVVNPTLDRIYGPSNADASKCDREDVGVMILKENLSELSLVLLDLDGEVDDGYDEDELADFVGDSCSIEDFMFEVVLEDF